jgi:hypothetical protein
VSTHTLQHTHTICVGLGMHTLQHTHTLLRVSALIHSTQLFHYFPITLVLIATAAPTNLLGAPEQVKKLTEAVAPF